MENKNISLNEEQYLSRINQLEKEIEYLHDLLDNAGISYKRVAKEIEDLSPDRNLVFDENQGARILPVTLTKQHVQYYYHLFKGRNDVYSKRSGKVNKKTGKHGYYTQCWNFWKDGICPKKNIPLFNCGECQNQRYNELTGQVLYEHLIGSKEDASDVIGLYPMFPDETVNFLVFDFDCHEEKIGGDDGANLDSEWMAEVNAFRKICDNVEIVIADKVYINTKNMKPRMQNALRRMAAFRNPDFYKKAAMGLSTKSIPRIIFCSYDDAGYICIPRALLDSVIDRFNEVDIPFSLTDNRCTGTPLDVSFNGTLYEEQMRGASAILEHDNGILAATTSFGKTVVGAYMIAQRKTNTLILVHNTEIQKNWIEDLTKFLDINAELPEYYTKTGRVKKRKSVIGKLYAGHNSMTGIIDVAIFSSLGKGDDIDPIIEQYGMVIMDEYGIIGQVRRRPILQAS